MTTWVCEKLTMRPLQDEWGEEDQEVWLPTFQTPWTVITASRMRELTVGCVHTVSNKQGTGITFISASPCSVKKLHKISTLHGKEQILFVCFLVLLAVWFHSMQIPPARCKTGKKWKRDNAQDESWWHRYTENPFQGCCLFLCSPFFLTTKRDVTQKQHCIHVGFYPIFL